MFTQTDLLERQRSARNLGGETDLLNFGKPTQGRRQSRFKTSIMPKPAVDLNSQSGAPASTAPSFPVEDLPSVPYKVFLGSSYSAKQLKLLCKLPNPESKYLDQHCPQRTASAAIMRKQMKEVSWSQPSLLNTPKKPAKSSLSPTLALPANWNKLAEAMKVEIHMPRTQTATRYPTQRLSATAVMHAWPFSDKAKPQQFAQPLRGKFVKDTAQLGAKRAVQRRYSAREATLHQYPKEMSVTWLAKQKPKHS